MLKKIADECGNVMSQWIKKCSYADWLFFIEM